jgi:hypothetical protein
MPAVRPGCRPGGGIEPECQKSKQNVYPPTGISAVRAGDLPQGPRS